MNEINIGRYRHYKGNEYTVIGTARQTGEDVLLNQFLNVLGQRRLIAASDDCGDILDASIIGVTVVLHAHSGNARFPKEVEERCLGKSGIGPVA
jgi:Protein of unknown function (DUF1653)